MKTIQWFPGHMTKARKNIILLLKQTDIVLELLDARAPLSSCNPLLQSLIMHKKKIKLLNKSDLADKSCTDRWLEYFNNESNSRAIVASMHNNKQKDQMIKLCKQLAPTKNSFEKPLRVMIIGIPNVGKSTLINQLINKKSAKTGDIPAVTKANQCLTISDDFLVYDTPGMMWEKIEYNHIAYNLAICNSIGRNAYDTDLLAIYLLSYLKEHMTYKLLLSARYKLTALDLTKQTNELLEIIARRRGCLLKNNILDLQKASELIVQDFRDGNLGKISLETPELWQQYIKIDADIEKSEKFDELI